MSKSDSKGGKAEGKIWLRLPSFLSLAVIEISMLSYRYEVRVIALR